MSLTIRKTAKSIIFEFDGFSTSYGAYVQGAFVGQFILPKKWAHLVRAGNEYEDLIQLHTHNKTRTGIVLRGRGTVQ